MNDNFWRKTDNGDAECRGSLGVASLTPYGTENELDTGIFLP